MFSVFSTALSALNANEVGIAVTGNNLANVNTAGYKCSTADFSELMSDNASGAQVGMGVGTPTTRTIFTQGPLQQNTGLLTAAIQGAGYFTVQDSGGEQLYTRVGNFKLDAQGNLQTQTGDTVLGTMGPIQVPSATLPPVESHNLTFDLNLDAGADIVTTSDPASFSAPIQVVDSLGETHMVAVDFWKTGMAAGTTTWTYAARSDQAGTTAQVNGAGTGTLSFDSTGKLTTTAPVTITIANSLGGPTLPDGANTMSLKWSLVQSDGTTPRLTQSAGTSACSAQWQDGSVLATQNKVSITDGGFVTVEYSNGVIKNVAQLQLASFRNPDSLVDVGNGQYKASAATSSPAVGPADSGGRGKVAGGQMEGSAVDMATEFANLIVYQRGYEAGARVVTTANQLTQDTINMMQG
jgi:flagellar hook protein FlgE